MATTQTIPNKEVRFFNTKIELRAEVGDNQQPVENIEGYALKFNSDSEVMGCMIPFIERIDPHALDGTDMSDVKCLINHDPNLPLGRNTITSGVGNLTMSVDNIGLHFKCTPTNTTYASDLKENLRSGVINQCSFAFTLDEDDPNAETITWNDADQIYERTILKIDTLYDVSCVTYPAYSDTEAQIGERSIQKMQKINEKRMQRSSNSPLETKKKMLDLMEKSL